MSQHVSHCPCNARPVMGMWGDAEKGDPPELPASARNVHRVLFCLQGSVVPPKRDSITFAGWCCSNDSGARAAQNPPLKWMELSPKYPNRVESSLGVGGFYRLHQSSNPGERERDRGCGRVLNFRAGWVTWLCEFSWIKFLGKGKFAFVNLFSAGSTTELSERERLLLQPNCTNRWISIWAYFISCNE